jgi:hypothetical protein
MLVSRGDTFKLPIKNTTSSCVGIRHRFYYFKADTRTDYIISGGTHGGY